MKKNTDACKREVLIEKIQPVEDNMEHLHINQEPKMKNRFVVKFPEEFELESWLVQRVEAPKFNMVTNKWDNMVICFLDLIGPSSSKNLYELMEWAKERKRGRAGRSKDFELFRFSIEVLDPTGVKVDSWIIIVKNVGFDFGNFNYSSDSLAMTKMIVEPKDCVYSY